MNILVTGGAGMIGSNLAKYLLDEGHAVVVVDDLSGGCLENVPPNAAFIGRDAGSESLREFFEIYKFDVVYHCAAFAAEGLSPFIRKFNYTNNLVVTANIVNLCIEYDCHLVFFSSIAAYGHGNPPFKESDHLTPCDPYGIAKAACEADIRCAHEQHGLRYTIFRPFNVYGINQNIKDRYRNVLGIWMNALLENNPIRIFGDGTQRRNFTWLPDIIRVLAAPTVTNMNGVTMNVGSDVSVSVNEVAQILIDVTGMGHIEYVENRHEVHTALPSVQLMQDMFGVQYTRTKDAIRQMWDWAKSNGNRPLPKSPEYEITKGMYGSWAKPQSKS